MTSSSPNTTVRSKPINPEKQIFYLSTLLQVQQHLRQAESSRELAYIIVNDTIQLLPYRQAVFWEFSGSGRIQIRSVSGTDQVDANAPYILFLKHLIQDICRQSEDGIKVLTAGDIDQELAADWSTWLPEYLLSCPLSRAGGDTTGGLLFMRPASFDPAEMAVLEQLGNAFSHANQALEARTPKLFTRFRLGGRRAIRLILIALALSLLCFPVHLSVLAPMEIIPEEPLVVAAPMDGAVKDFMVTPNQPVKAGQALFALDDIRIRNEHDIALKTLAVVKADELRARQKAFADDTSRAELLLLKARIQEQKATVEYLAEKLDRSRVKAAEEGIAVFSDTNDWLGKPVVVGEKIMTIADPQKVAAEIQLPVADAINLAPGAKIRLFLNISPDSPIAASLHQTAYEAQLTADGILAFRLKARLADSENLPRIGLRGTAKIYGEKVSLFYYLLRRPLAFARQFLGI